MLPWLHAGDSLAVATALHDLLLNGTRLQTVAAAALSKPDSIIASTAVGISTTADGNVAINGSADALVIRQIAVAPAYLVAL